MFRSPIARRADENVEKLSEIIHTGKRSTINDACNIWCVQCDTCRPISPANLNMRWTAAKFVLRLLNDDKKQTRSSEFKACEIRQKKDTDFLPKVKDWGERWVYCYDPDSTISWKYTSWISGDTGQGQVVRVPALLPAVGKALFTVCKFQNGIICEGKYRAVNKVTGFVTFFQSSNLWLALYACRERKQISVNQWGCSVLLTLNSSSYALQCLQKYTLYTESLSSYINPLKTKRRLL